MTRDEKLIHLLKIKYGLPPQAITQSFLANVKKDVLELHRLGQGLSEAGWEEIVKRHCPTAGTYCYKGLDTSDLVTLLNLATNLEVTEDD